MPTEPNPVLHHRLVVVDPRLLRHQPAAEVRSDRDRSPREADLVIHYGGADTVGGELLAVGAEQVDRLGLQKPIAARACVRVAGGLPDALVLRVVKIFDGAGVD